MGPAVDAARPTEEPLTPDETRRVKRDLLFIRKHRKILRLPLNSTENLLVDGAREPQHRGILTHLLAKVDRASAMAALARKPVCDDARARAEVLGGVARISGDMSVLLLWLDALTEGATEAAAAAAFAATAERIDFSTFSASQMGKLLGVMEKAFSGHDLIQALFGLLESESFRGAFDTSAAELDASARERFVPLRAVHDAYLTKTKERRRGRREEEDERVAAGLRILLAAPPKVLAGYRQGVREALLRAALRDPAPSAEVEAALHALLGSLPEKGEAFARHGWSWAARLVRERRDEEALPLLRRVVAAHPSHERAVELRDALMRARVGRFALEHDDPGLDHGGFRPAFWLERRVPAYLRLEAASKAARVEVEADLQWNACIPGVLPLLTRGVAAGGRPYVAVPAPCGSLRRSLPGPEGRDLHQDVALALAAEGALILRSLALAGIRLPDASPSRFAADLSGAVPVLLLADFSGAEPGSPARVEEAHRGPARDLARALLAFPPLTGERIRREVPRPIREALDGEPLALAELVRLLQGND